MLISAQTKLRLVLDHFCLWFAYLGGATMCLSILVIVVSISRGIFGSPILGDSEIVELLIGIAIFCFLPYCHLHNGNIIVDFLSKALPRTMNDFLDALMNLGFGCVAYFIMIQTARGGISAFERDWHSMFLQLPEWPVYLIASVALILWICVIALAVFEAMLRATGLLEPCEDAPEFG